VAAQVGRDRPCLRLADPCRQLGRRRLGEGGQVREDGADRRVALPEASTFGGFGVGEGEPAHVEGQGPAVLGRQMGEAGHGRALQPLIDDLVEAEHAALTGALHIREGDRGRIKPLGARAVGASGHPMADRALLGIERRAAGQIRRERRRQRARIGRQHRAGERLGPVANDARIRLVPDGRLQGLGVADQTGLGRIRRQGVQAGPDLAAELDHLPVFGRIGHLTVGHRAGVIDRDIVEQPPGDLGLGGGRRLGEGGGGQPHREQQGEQAEQRAHGQSRCERLALAFRRRRCRALFATRPGS